MDTLSYVPSGDYFDRMLSDGYSVMTWRMGDVMNGAPAPARCPDIELGERVVTALVVEPGRDARVCRRCGSGIVHVERNVWATTGEGLSFCPPDPDRGGRGNHKPREPRGAEWIGAANP